MQKRVPARNQINVFNSQRRFRVSVDAIRGFARLAAHAAGISGCEFTIQFVGPRKMLKLNRSFRGKDYVTDVLSFSGWSGPDLSSYMGDIVICPAAAALNSRNLGKELKVLVLHGMLHLMHYDHETDNGEMNRFERRLRRKLVPS